MHPSVQDFVRETVTDEMVRGRYVLEVGAYDVNGSVRPCVSELLPAEYLGVDASAGPGVDRVVDCEHLVSYVGNAWDLVISTEMLEHVDDWRRCLIQLSNAVAMGGYLIITTRSPGFPYHPFPVDNWRYTTDQMRKILGELNLRVDKVRDDPQAPGVFALAYKPVCDSSHKTCWPVDYHVLDAVNVERV